MEFKFKNIHIGSLIRQLVKEQWIEKERIIKFLKVSEYEIEQMYAVKSMETELLLRWSKLLNYDFFRIYSQHLVWYAPSSGNRRQPLKKGKESKLPQFRKNVYTTELIEFIVELVQSGEKSTDEIVNDYRIPRNTLYRWLEKYEK